MNTIHNQMMEFQNSIASIESRFHLICSTAKDTLCELEEAKECFVQATSGYSAEEIEKANKFKDHISELVYKECDSLKESFKSLNNLTNDCNEFKEREAEARQQFYVNPAEFGEKDLKKLLTSTTNKSTNVHPLFEELEELIQNAKDGVANDLVIDEPNAKQVAKCPITRALIQDPVKNTKCDHVYEKAAIRDYTKGKPNVKKCPVAGCPQYVAIKF